MGPASGSSLTPNEVESETLASLRSTMDVLAAKAPDEAAAIGSSSSASPTPSPSSKSGVEPNETAALDKIKQALGA